ncbi:nitrilase-related carbon-nitrogen hydrolase [Salinibacter altiplanensis]|uniref:nitrilase-related carbon-nitrogen hydrolase n=1 Tax=Salinibacter altiplanensis TaxID=1803181 RepID=UPI000C9F881F|nr:nitrilase-related carbon-nitrogen hydrolase [Salinibacter altiplanensis]
MRAAYLQFAPKYLEVDQNLAAVESQLHSVEADLIVLPELFTSGYFFQSKDDLREVAEPIPNGRSVSALQSWAESLEAVLVAGLAEREGDRFYNSAVVVRPSGEVDTYRKVHLFYEETTLFEPGDLGLRVFAEETSEGKPYRLGIMVCFDWYFPEAARTLAMKGADVIAHPSNLVLPHCPDSMPVRARENHVFTITANRYGSETKGEDSLQFIGMSEIRGPSGAILNRAGESEDVVEEVELDPHEARDRRINDHNDVLGDRRPDVYATQSERGTKSAGQCDS